MSRAFTGIRACSTLGTLLRAVNHGDVKQLHGVHKQVLAALAAGADLLTGSDEMAFVDADSMHRQVYEAADVRGRAHTATPDPLLSTRSSSTSSRGRI